MPRSRFSALPVERQEMIIEAAGREFAAHGYEGASLNQVLRAAGISKGAAYYYFEDKSDLYLAVLQHYWNQMIGEPILNLDGLTVDGFWEWMDELYGTLLVRCAERPWLLGLGASVWNMPTSSRADDGRLGIVVDMWRGWFMAMVRKGREIGAIRTDIPEDLVINMLAAVDEAGGTWLQEHWHEFQDPVRDAREMRKKTLGMIRGMFAPVVPTDGNGDH